MKTQQTHHLITNLGEFELDQWLTLSEDYDINLFSNEKGEIYYNVYKVEEGAIDTNQLLGEGYLTVTGTEK